MSALCSGHAGLSRVLLSEWCARFGADMIVLLLGGYRVLLEAAAVRLAERACWLNRVLPKVLLQDAV